MIEQVLMRSLKSAGGLTRGRGFSESVRHQWTFTAHQYATIHDAMTRLSNVHLTTSDQHVEMTDARRSRDFDDCQKMYAWIKDRNPFLKTDKRLKSLSTGVTADEGSGINCDDAEHVGEEIHDKLDNIPLAEAKIKRKGRVVCLDATLNAISVEKKSVIINPTLLFNRLSALAGREENVEKYFGYELTTYPMSLFKDGIMRKPDKASLRKRMLTKEMSSPSIAKKVIDGGYEVASVKDQEHSRRSSRSAAIEIQFNDETKVKTKREDFLTNSNNKSSLISKLAVLLECDGQEVVLAKSDADTEIVKVAIEVMSISVLFLQK